jgi:hypothetical protein
MTDDGRSIRGADGYAMIMGKEATEYISSFPYHIEVEAGPVYNETFKDFSAWCNNSLGVKFKDWFLLSTGKNSYRLYMRDTKHSMFLSLKYSNIITSSKL